MPVISSTLKPSRACRMKTSRGPEPRSRRAEAIRRNSSSEAMICSGVAMRASAITVGLVKLQLGFVASPHIARARGIFQRDGVAVALVGAAEFVQGSQCQPIEPGLERETFGFFLTVAQSGGDGFVNYFFLREAVGSD